jgi:serine/threonine-protein kinase
MPIQLRTVRGKNLGNTYSVEDDTTMIFGRSPSADSTLDDASLSRYHMMISMQGEVAKVTDLESTNGTYLNGHPVHEAEISSGDCIAIGTHIFVVEVSHVRRPAAPRRHAMDDSPGLAFCSRCHRAVQKEEIHESHAGGGVTCKFCATGATFDVNIIERYKLLEKIRDDQLGPVFLAKHLSLSSRVEIKIISPGGPVTEKIMKQFMREAKVWGQLHHPNIVEMLDAGCSNDVYFIALEHFDGETLKQRLERQGPLSSEEVAYLAFHVAMGLEHAFNHAVVHRNINPGTIIFTENEEIKIADFGMAKSMTESGLSGITQMGEGKGTVPYMPPEQFVGALNVDQRSDIYSLGVTLYEALTGQLPFHASSVLMIMKKIADGNYTPLRKINKKFPKKLCALVEKAMHMDPNKRFQTPPEILMAIRKLS